MATVDWAEIADFPEYLVSIEGDIHDRTKKRNLKTHLNQMGFLTVSLRQDDRRYTRSVSRIVAEGFVHDRLYDTFDTVIHLDGDKTNVNAFNLMWRPRWFAVKYHQQFESSRFPTRFPVELIETGEVYKTHLDCCVQYGLREIEVVQNLTHGHRVFPGGFNFRYVR